jgi:hypothetical protein
MSFQALTPDHLASVVGGADPSPTAQKVGDLAAQMAQMRAAPGCVEKGEREGSQKVIDDCLKAAADEASRPMISRINKIPLVP